MYSQTRQEDIKEAMTIYQGTYLSPLGDITLQGDGQHITALYFVGQKYDGTLLDGTFLPFEGHDLYKRATTWLTAYFEGKNPPPTSLPLAPKGTAFQRRVWQKLQHIPYGKVTTYGTIAAMIAEENGQDHFSAQAVGSAVGHNPLSILIPCHRVIGKKGSLTGYAGGLDRKEWLLHHEKNT